MKKTLSVCAALAAAAVIGPTAAFAHPHVVSTSGQVLATVRATAHS